MNSRRMGKMRRWGDGEMVMGFGELEDGSMGQWGNGRMGRGGSLSS